MSGDLKNVCLICQTSSVFFFVKCELLVNWREKVREFEDARKKVRREEREAPVYKQDTYVTRTMGGNIPKIRSQFKKVSN